MCITWEQAAPVQNKHNEAANWRHFIMQEGREKEESAMQYRLTHNTSEA